MAPVVAGTLLSSSHGLETSHKRLEMMCSCVLSSSGAENVFRGSWWLLQHHILCPVWGGAHSCPRLREYQCVCVCVCSRLYFAPSNQPCVSLWGKCCPLLRNSGPHTRYIYMHSLSCLIGLSASSRGHVHGSVVGLLESRHLHWDGWTFVH